MAWEQADLDKLKRMVTSGVRAVTFSDGRNVTYRTLEELKQAIAMVAAELGVAAGTPRVRRRRFTSCKGL